MKKTCPLLITTFLWGLLSFSTVFAQETQRTFTISPPSVVFNLNPGEETERPIKITNQSAEPMSFVVELNDFVVTDDKGTPELLPIGTLTDNKFAASTWATALPDTFTVNPGNSQTTTLYLRVPKDARPGGRYFSVTFRPVANASLETSGAAVNTVIGSLVYLTVLGPMDEAAEVVRFSAPKLSEFGPITLSTEIANSGDAHINPKATIQISNLIGKKVFSDVLRSANIFPGTTRSYENNWNKKWLFGRYKASLNGYYGDNSLPLMADAVFWVIPYRLILGIILAIVIITLIVSLAKSRSKREEPIDQPI